MRYPSSLPIAIQTFFTFFGLVLGHSLQPHALQSRAQPAGSCPKNLNLTSQTWNDLKMNEYLMSYPNIDKITLKDFASEVGAANFFCGINQFCNAGQICSPVVDRNWFILVAAQKWNSQLNNLYASINTASQIVDGACSSIIKDFLPDTPMEKGFFGWAIATLVISILGGFSGAFVPLFAPKEIKVAVAAYRSEASLAEAAANYEEARAAAEAGDLVRLAHLMETRDTEVIVQEVEAAHALTHPTPPLVPSDPLPVTFPANPIHSKRSHLVVSRGTATSDKTHPKHFLPRGKLEKRSKPPPSAYTFDVYGAMKTHISELRSRLLNVVETIATMGTSEPIWSDNGIAAQLINGTILGALPTQIQNQEEHLKFAKLIALSELFISQNFFVTVDSDPCNKGAWAPDKFLSYCTPQGSMRNIIRAEGIHARNEFKNALILANDYFSVQFLTDKAIACQAKYGIYTEQKYPAPSSIDSDCAFVLPVCDLKLEAVAHIKKKKKGTVRACRKGANLPI